MGLSRCRISAQPYSTARPDCQAVLKPVPTPPGFSGLRRASGYSGMHGRHNPGIQSQGKQSRRSGWCRTPSALRSAQSPCHLVHPSQYPERGYPVHPSGILQAMPRRKHIPGCGILPPVAEASFQAGLSEPFASLARHRIFRS